MPDKPKNPQWGEFGEDEFGFFATLLIATVTHVFRWIPPGTFMMGSPEDEPDRLSNEGPQHEVTLTKDYWLGETPVTNYLWLVVMGFSFDNERYSPECPVDLVSWHSCGVFIDKLNFSVKNLGLRLPTEAEWEYACRAGTVGATWRGNDPSSLIPIAQDVRNQLPVSEKVRVMEPNPWGLYDMLGNVWEWCDDVYGRYPGYPVVDPTGPDPSLEHANYRVIRGGCSFAGSQLFSRAALRAAYNEDSLSDSIGFRLAISGGH